MDNFKYKIMQILKNALYIILNVILGMIIPMIVIVIITSSDVLTYKDIFSSAITWILIFICVMFTFFYNSNN
jgi:DMSO/TMAO reductase YedYZ heme-binding membrane subunit